MGTLYVVGTPIGHLGDLSPRAREVLGSVGLILAEDTRVTRKLLARFAIATPLASCHAHTAPARRAALIGRLEAHDVALVTDAGTPGISDPGADVVAAAVAAGHDVVTVPGPSAVTAALAVAGLPADRYLFLGFPARKAAARRAEFAAVATMPWTLVLFEAPHRLVATLDDLFAALGDRPVAIARELTKRHEEVWRGTLAAARVHLADAGPRGEFTLVVAGAPDEAIARWDEARVRAALAAHRAAGEGRRAASRAVAPAAGWLAREVYALWPDGPSSGKL